MTFLHNIYSFKTLKTPLSRMIPLTLSLIGLSACSGSSSSNGSALTCGADQRISVSYAGPAEAAYCSTISSYSPASTITGTATYQAREVTGSGLGAPGAASPIRFAEVRVTDSSGNTIQCGETDASGNFSVALPQGSSTYTVSVSSRGNNSQVIASVLNKPEANEHYVVSKTTTAATSGSMGTINATATGAILGGAFNIFEKIVESNIYLRSQLSSCSASINNCANFTVAPKVSAYWEKGFNPNCYFEGESGLSFYLPDYDRLFILGGSNGDTDTFDTDHFDNSVIVHEYGHFIEDALSASDSPGGQHTGNKLIDPRLALSEAWGNFLQAAVLNLPGAVAPKYIDTIGNVDGSTDFYFNINLETPDPICGGFPGASGCDEPQLAGEGVFREYAITRYFWDIIDTNNDSDSVSGGFNEIWASLTAGNGYLSANAGFRSAGFLNLIQSSLTGGGAPTDWTTLQSSTAHRQGANTAEYGNYVATGGGCGAQNFSVTPYSFPEDDGEFANSHLLRNNDFHYYQHAGGALTLQLNYTTASGTEADLDLYLYNESGRFGVGTDLVDRSTQEPNGVTADVESETITLPNLAAGKYLINMHVYTKSVLGSATSYEILAGGSRLCPSSIP